MLDLKAAFEPIFGKFVQIHEIDVSIACEVGAVALPTTDLPPLKGKEGKIEFVYRYERAQVISAQGIRQIGA